MTTNEAKQKLLLYRGTIDDSDPQFHAALDCAKSDPELGQWLREQTNCYDVIRSKLRQTEPTSDLAQKIIRSRPIPFRRDWAQILKLAAAIIISASITAVSIQLWDRRSNHLAQGKEITVRGEVLDMTCYIASNLSGPEHAICAKECIKRGLPAGIKSEDGKVYLLTGKPGDAVSAELADYAAQIVTIRGKESIRDGFAQLQIEEIRKL